MRLLFVGPELCLRLPSDIASRRFGCIPPAAGCIRVFRALEMYTAGRTRKKRISRPAAGEADWRKILCAFRKAGLERAQLMPPVICREAASEALVFLSGRPSSSAPGRYPFPHWSGAPWGWEPAAAGPSAWAGSGRRSPSRRCSSAPARFSGG